MQRAWFVIAALLLAAAACAAAQSCPRRAVIGVVDGRRGPLADFTAADLEPRARRGAVTITNLAPVAAPRVLLLFDVSGSMASSRRGAQAALAGARRALPASQWAALAFAGAFQWPRPMLGSDTGALDELAIRLGSQRTYGGGSAVYDAVALGARAMRNARASDAVVLVSDGGDDRSRLSAKRLAAYISPSGPTLYLLRFDEGMPDAIGELDQAIVASGGFVANATRKPAVAGAVMALIARDIEARKVATVAITGAPTGAMRWRLRLSRTYRRAHRGAEVFYPHTVAACASGGAATGR